MEYLIYVGIFLGGFFIGFLTWAWLRTKLIEYNAIGTIVVDKDELTDKTVYTLELDDFPEKLESKNLVIFKVVPSEEKVNRE